VKKYKVLETEIRQWNDKQFKVAELEGPAGEVHSNVSVWARLDEVRAGNVIEGDIDASGKGKKFVFPSSATVNLGVFPPERHFPVYTRE